MNKEIIRQEIMRVAEVVTNATQKFDRRGRMLFLRGILLPFATLSSQAVNADVLSANSNYDYGNTAVVSEAENMMNGEEMTKGTIQLKPFQVLALSGQKIKVGGVDLNINPEQHPDQRITVVVASKSDLTLDVEYGPGTFSGLFKMPEDMSDFGNNIDAILKVQSSRNDLPGNCLPQGCVGGSQEVAIVASQNNSGIVFEPGVNRIRSFQGTQLQLPENIAYLGTPELVKSANALPAVLPETSFTNAIQLNAFEMLTISAQEINAAGVLTDVNPRQYPDKRATVGIVAKNNVALNVQTGPGSWKGKFQLPQDSERLLDNANKILDVQSSRNDLPGNCLPQGCVGGSVDVLFVAYRDKDGKTVYEPTGGNRTRPFLGTQLQLPPEINYLGEVK